MTPVGHDRGPRHRSPSSTAATPHRAAGPRSPRPSRPSTARGSSSTSTTSRPRAAPATSPTRATARATATPCGRTRRPPSWLARGRPDRHRRRRRRSSSAISTPTPGGPDRASLERRRATRTSSTAVIERRRTRTCSTASGATSTTRSARRRGRARSPASPSGTSTPTSRPCSTTTPSSRRPAQVASLYAPDQFRVSDHDPIVVGLDAAQRPRRRRRRRSRTRSSKAGRTTQLSATGLDPDRGRPSRTRGISMGMAQGSRRAASRCRSRRPASKAPLTRTIRVRTPTPRQPGRRRRRPVKVIWDVRRLPASVGVATGGQSVDRRRCRSWSSSPLAGNQGLGVLDGTPRFSADDCATHTADRSTDHAISTIGPALVYERRTDTYAFTWKTAQVPGPD